LRCLSKLKPKVFKYAKQKYIRDNMKKENFKKTKKNIDLEEDENNVEIMFSDLTPEAQKKLLRAFHVRSPEDMNWDVVPIAVIPISDE